MAAQEVVCTECLAAVACEVIHLGFSSLDLLFCSACPRGLLLDPPELNGLREVSAADPLFEPYNNHLVEPWREVEAGLPACICGGSFRYLNPPRCPQCRGLLRGDCYKGRIIEKQRDYDALLPGSTVRHGS